MIPVPSPIDKPTRQIISSGTAGRRLTVLWLLLAGLVFVQQDFVGWWDAPVIVMGFVPLPLAIQLGVSLAAAAVWWWATRCCWPDDLVTIDHEPTGGGPR